MFKVVKVVLGLLVLGVCVCIIMKGVKKFFERRRLMVVGEAEGISEGHMFWFGVVVTFFGAVLMLGE